MVLSRGASSVQENAVVCRRRGRLGQAFFRAATACFRASIIQNTSRRIRSNFNPQPIWKSDNISYRCFGAHSNRVSPNDGALLDLFLHWLRLARSRAQAWSGARSRRDSRDGSRRWGSSRSRCRRRDWRRRWSRFAGRSDEGINFVVGRIVNAAASDNACVPLACARHHFVRPAAIVDHRAGIAIICVQSLVASAADGPNNHVVCAIRRSNKERPASCQE